MIMVREIQLILGREVVVSGAEPVVENFANSETEVSFCLELRENVALDIGRPFKPVNLVLRVIRRPTSKERVAAGKAGGHLCKSVVKRE
jgi:hypothetical protein